MKKIVIASFALLSLAASCKKQKGVMPSPQTVTSLTGKWRWVASYSETIAGIITQTPESTGSHEELTFNADNTFTDILNGTIVGSGSFTTGASGTYDSVNFAGVMPGWPSNIHYQFSHDTVSFFTPVLPDNGGSKLWIKE